MSTENDTDFESAFAAAMGETVDTAGADTGADADAATGVDDTTSADADTGAATDADTDASAGADADTGVDDTTGTDEDTGAAADAGTDDAVATAASTVAQQPLDPKFLAQAIAEEQESRRVAAEATAKQQEQQQQQDKTFTAEDFLDDKQKAAVELLNSEWSEVAGPVQALIAANVQAALANQKREILTQVQQQMAPIQQATVKSQEAMHWGSIAAAHPDYQTVANALPAWIESQPFKVAQKYMHAYQGGSTAEVVELITAYKQAIGSTGAAPAHPASSAVQATPRVAPVSKAALAATAAPPKAQRSTVTTSRDPGDFESAFAEAVAR